MNRKIQKRSLHTPVFLDKASSVSERAARAMCPNGRDTMVANQRIGNVITLQESNLHGDTPLSGKSRESGNFPGQRSQVHNLFSKKGGADEH
ncbi:hypothetical protein [Roseibium sp. SCP14]|uniref:hypothetical protein n=1 Tax=Roseibium sp. SCP14 TaxID=3141375 RepID=UPI00333C1CC6